MEDRISIDKEICSGLPCIKGTRITVSIVLDCLADGMGNESLLEEFPSLKREDIQACLQFASEFIKAYWILKRAAK